MVIKTDIESALEPAIHSSESVLCSYDGFDVPQNWERYTGSDCHDFHDGEVVLIAWECGDSSFDWTFRVFDEEQRQFKRKSGFYYMPPSRGSSRWQEYIVYRYVGGAEDSIDIPSPRLEDVL